MYDTDSVFVLDAFLTQITAIKTARSVKTRRLSQAECNEEVAQTVKLAQVFRQIYSILTSAKGNVFVHILSSFILIFYSSTQYHVQSALQ